MGLEHLQYQARYQVKYFDLHFLFFLSVLVGTVSLFYAVVSKRPRLGTL